MTTNPPTVQQKALRINLDAKRYGTFAEIGAGQEVARCFFRAGGASGTVAKTMSAYDMAVSDAIYGPAERYVSRQRLRAMLDHEYQLLIERLDQTRGAHTAFFAFANTVATSGYKTRNDGHGWLGLRFQAEPRQEPSEVLIHVRLLDKEADRQQEVLGVVGVNLIHACFYAWHDPQAIVRELLDGLTWEHVEVDLIRFSGPAFASVDNRLMALQLVQCGHTEAAMFRADGEAVQWGELLYKKPVLILRGSFRPVTLATLDVLERAHDAFAAECRAANTEPVTLLEMTLRHLTTGDAIDHADYLERVDMLCALGRPVLISNFRRFHRLASYLSRYTNQPLGLALGASKLREIFDERFYNESEGGLLGGLGQLFKNRSRLYVYPSLDFATGAVLTAENFSVPPGLRHLLAHLRENHALRPLTPSREEWLRLRSHDVLERIRAGAPDWSSQVPPAIAERIRARKLLGFRG
ncbi:MAG: TonB-dependent receptor [Limisphaerales bacterium]|jgi:hypothetical protein